MAFERRKLGRAFPRNQLAGGCLLDRIASLILNPTLRKIVIKTGRRMLPVSVLDSLVIKSIAVSAFIRDAKKPHGKWERRMCALWN